MSLKRIVSTCFGGSIERAVAVLLDIDDTELTTEEVAQLRHAIDKVRQEGR